MDELSDDPPIVIVNVQSVKNETEKPVEDISQSSETFSILLGLMLALFILNLIALILLGLVCYYRKKKFEENNPQSDNRENDAHNYGRNPRNKLSRNDADNESGDNNIFAITGMYTKNKHNNQRIASLKYENDVSLLEPQNALPRSPRRPAPVTSVPPQSEDIRKTTRSKPVNNFYYIPQHLSDDEENMPPQWSPQVTPDWSNNEESYRVYPESDNGEQRLHPEKLISQTGGDIYRRPHQSYDNYAFEEQQNWPIKNGENFLQPTVDDEEQQILSPPAMSSELINYDQFEDYKPPKPARKHRRHNKQRYAQSLRNTSANYLYGTGPAYYPMAGRASVTATTGSASSLDSGYLGGSTPKGQAVGKKYRIRAKVHAEDDRSATSDSVQQNHYHQQHGRMGGTRKLTLSNSQTVSDV